MKRRRPPHHLPCVHRGATRSTAASRWQLQGSSTSQWKPWHATAALRFIPVSRRSPFPA